MKERGDTVKGEKLPFLRILSNNWFMLKLVAKTAPHILIATFLDPIIGALLNFFVDTWLLRYIVNGIGAEKNFVHLVFVILILYGTRFLFWTLSNYYWNRFYSVGMIDVTRKLKETVFRKAAAVELRCYEDPAYYNQFVKALSECGNRTYQVIGAIENAVYAVISFSANFALLVAIDPILLLFALLPLSVIPIQAKTNKVKYERDMKLQEENRRKGYARRTFYLADYAKEMRLTPMPVLMLQRFRESGARAVALWKKYGLTRFTCGYVIDFCNEVATALGATLYAVWQTFVHHRMLFGDCLVVVNSIEGVAYALTSSAGTVLNFQEQALYIENLRAFLDYEPTLKGGLTPLPEDGDIVLENVSFRYEGADRDALQNVSMRFGRNEKIAIVGHNGAGKTTLIKLLLRLYDAEGSIRYGGTEIKEFPLEAYRDMFASVMQDVHMFALSVAENVLLDKRFDGDEILIRDALQKSGLYEKTNSFANGIDTVMTKEFDDNGEMLSGGEMQKLAIAHIYAKQNRFVILDEPSSALDPIAEHEMYERMTKACENCGMIFISHRLSSAVMADRIYYMENGTVAECGTHKELMTKNGKYAQLFRRQAENYTEVTV